MPTNQCISWNQSTFIRTQQGSIARDATITILSIVSVVLAVVPSALVDADNFNAASTMTTITKF